MSNYVFVLDTNKTPLDPVHPKEARDLLNQGKAAIFRRFPFTVILKESIAQPPTPSIQLKIDPGSVTTGIALVKDGKLIWGAEFTHRGRTIKKSLLDRASVRRNRRSRKTRYRPARFNNRKRAEGWLPPSLMHRVHTTMTWVKRLIRFAPIVSIAQELNRFDTQKMMNPEVSGVEYQQGELFGYEVREYLLEKWGRQCAYCSKTDAIFEVDHIHPRSKGGSDRVSNLTIACHECNQKKGNKTIQEFLKKKTDILNRVLAKAKKPLGDTAAVNATRWVLHRELKETGLLVSVGTGGQTKYNRTRLNIPKAHYLDAACVGNVESLEVLITKPLRITATGHGSRQMCVTDKYGFPKQHKTRNKNSHDFQTGDIAIADIPGGKYKGRYVGRVTIRQKPNFSIKPTDHDKIGVHAKYLKKIHSNDGYSYQS